MKTAVKIPAEQRRAAIIKAAQQVFVEKGFNATTTRELAAAAGVSEALLFKHFTNKEAIYEAILTAAFEDAGAKFTERLGLTPSTSALVSLIHDSVHDLLFSHPDEAEHRFFRLVFRSLLDEGEFTRLALQGPPLQYARKIGECLKAARAAGDMVDTAIRPNLSGWFAHHLVSGLVLHSLPGKSVIDYKVSQQELCRQLVWFCLQGMGLKEDAIRRHWKYGNIRQET